MSRRRSRKESKPFQGKHRLARIQRFKAHNPNSLKGGKHHPGKRKS